MTSIPYSSDLDWLITQSDAAFGLRSAFAAQVAAIERGGPSAGIPATWPTATAGTIESRQGRRWGRIWRAWRLLGTDTQTMLAAHYSNGRLPLRVEASLGEAARCAVMLAVQLGQAKALLTACEKGEAGAVTRWAKRGTSAAQAAHIRWQEAVERESEERERDPRSAIARYEIREAFREYGQPQEGTAAMADRLERLEREAGGFFGGDRAEYE